MDISAAESIVTSSKEFTSLSLYLVGGSIATILGTSYKRPTGRVMKCTYLLFFFGWFLLAVSFYYGNDVTTRGIMAIINKDKAQAFENSINSMVEPYQNQTTYFYSGLLLFGLWLVSYLFWWIFNKEKNEQSY